MTRTRLLQISALAAATLLLSASVALAQNPPPPPPPGPAGAYPPPPPPPPADMPPPAPMPTVAAMTAPKSADDMTGSIGFGIGIGSSSQLLSSSFADAGLTKQVALRYWSSDTFVLQPALNFTLNKTDGDAGVSWTLAPEALALFVPIKGASTRVLVGGGLGIGLVHPSGGDTSFSFYLPVQAGVEHFFTRWFGLGLAARSNFFWMATGDPYMIQMALSNTSLFGSAFIYTD